MPVKKSMRVKKPASSSKKAAKPAVAPDAKAPVRWMRTFGAETIFIALMCVMAAAMLVAAAHSTSDTPARPRAAVEPDATLPQPEPTTTVASAGLSSTTDTVEPESVGTTARMTTVSGCLDRSDESFRLKDTSGADAPKARSWKSGFLRKSTASIDVIDATHRLRLANHVGQRVSLTGTLEDRSMQARSLQRIAGTCR